MVKSEEISKRRMDLRPSKTTISKPSVFKNDKHVDKSALSSLHTDSESDEYKFQIKTDKKEKETKQRFDFARHSTVV